MWLDTSRHTYNRTYERTYERTVYRVLVLRVRSHEKKITCYTWNLRETHEARLKDTKAWKRFFLARERAPARREFLRRESERQLPSELRANEPARQDGACHPRSSQDARSSGCDRLKCMRRHEKFQGVNSTCLPTKKGEEQEERIFFIYRRIDLQVLRALHA